MSVFVGRLRPLLGVLCAAATLLVETGPATAVVKTWDPSGCGFSCSWQTAGNWDPTGVPIDGDDVFINTAFSLLMLTNDTAEINFLDLTTTSLQTNGFTLNVHDSLPAQLTTMAIRGGATSGTGAVVLLPSFGDPGLFAESVRIANRGVIVLQNDGSEAEIASGLVIDFGGELRSNGVGTHTLDLRAFRVDSGRALDNNGTITADGGITLFEHPGANDAIDLDGEFEVGIVNISSGATLRFDALSFVQTDPFDGTMNIGAGGATAVLEYPVWSVGAGGVVSLNNGEFQSDFFQNNGEIRGHGLVAVGEFTNNGTLSGDGGTLVVAPTANFNFASNPGSGVLNAVTGDLEILTGTGLPSYDGVVNVGSGHELRTDDRVELEAGALANLTGGTILSGLTADPMTTIHVMAGPESRLEAVSGGHTLDGAIILDGDLRLIGNTVVGGTATVSGAGTLIVDAATILCNEGSLILGGGLRNEGIVRPGLSAGQITASADYLQTAEATLGIELGSVTPGTGYDVIGAGGQAQLAGTLDVSLIDDFQPVAGDLFTILTADGGVTGQFDTVNLPTLSDSLELNLIYNPRNVTLQVTGQILPGDYNADGIVNAADYVVWRNHLDQSVSLPNDLTPGDVTQSDYTAWQNNFGATAGSGSVSVPEPAGLLLLVAVVAITSIDTRAFWLR